MERLIKSFQTFPFTIEIDTLISISINILSQILKKCKENAIIFCKIDKNDKIYVILIMIGGYFK